MTMFCTDTDHEHCDVVWNLNLKSFSVFVSFVGGRPSCRSCDVFQVFAVSELQPTSPTDYLYSWHFEQDQHELVSKMHAD